MAKARTHEFVVRLRFDRPCSRSVAVREVRDNIHGEFFTTQLDDSEPGKFRIVSVKAAPAARASSLPDFVAAVVKADAVAAEVRGTRQREFIGWRREERAREAAHARGWRHGGDGTGIIYDSNVFESWKAAASWAGNDGRDERERESRVYSTWRECCEAEGIEVPS